MGILGRITVPSGITTPGGLTLKQEFTEIPFREPISYILTLFTGIAMPLKLISGNNSLELKIKRKAFFPTLHSSTAVFAELSILVMPLGAAGRTGLIDSLMLHGMGDLHRHDTGGNCDQPVPHDHDHRR